MSNMNVKQARSLVRVINLLLDEGADIVTLSPHSEDEQLGVPITVTGTQHWASHTRRLKAVVGINGVEMMSTHEVTP